MVYKIEKKIRQGLPKFISDIDRAYSLSKISPLLFKSIKEFVLRKGKLIRPTLFAAGYLGFSKKPARRLYTSALSLEFLHDFMLVHDDIIDKSNTRRGKPSMHKMLGGHLGRVKGAKVSGEDLAIVAGDVMYALGILAFLSIKESMARKEKALKKFIEAAVYTGGGEFIELLYGITDIEKINKADIYRIYDYKTANYTFAYPLSVGAILAGANQKQTDILFKYGIYLGRAFQIKDDILGMFSSQERIGKSALTDLQEAKKTVLIWYAYNHTGRLNKSVIKNTFAKKNIGRQDLLKMRKIITGSGAREFAQKEVLGMIKKAQRLLALSNISPGCKEFLDRYCRKILSL